MTASFIRNYSILPHALLFFSFQQQKLMRCKCSVTFKKAAAFARGGTLAPVYRCNTLTLGQVARVTQPPLPLHVIPRTKDTQTRGSARSQQLSNGWHHPLWWTQVWHHVQRLQSLRFYRKYGCLFDNNSGNPLPLIFTTDWRGAKISSSHLKIFFIFEGALIRWKTYKTGTPCIMKSIVVVFFLFVFLCRCRTFSDALTDDPVSWMEQWLTRTDVLDSRALRITPMGLRSAR